MITVLTSIPHCSMGPSFSPFVYIRSSCVGAVANLTIRVNEGKLMNYNLNNRGISMAYLYIQCKTQVCVHHFT